MQNLNVILSLVGTIAGLIVTAATFLIKFIKNGKAKKIAENIIEIGNAVIPYIKRAEEFAQYTSAEKKEYVMTKANQYAIENGIPFDAAAVDEKIEELVRLTKHVNARPQDKPAAATNEQADNN